MRGGGNRADMLQLLKLHSFQMWSEVCKIYQTLIYCIIIEKYQTVLSVTLHVSCFARYFMSEQNEASSVSLQQNVVIIIRGGKWMLLSRNRSHWIVECFKKSPLKCFLHRVDPQTNMNSHTDSVSAWLSAVWIIIKYTKQNTSQCWQIYTSEHEHGSKGSSVCF